MAQLIVALDKMDGDRTVNLARKICGTFPQVGIKVNDVLREEGYKFIHRLRCNGVEFVMADLKLHDIPNTIANDCERLRRYEPNIVTVHATGDVEMVQKAVETLGPAIKVFGISSLTSLSSERIQKIYHRSSTEMATFCAALMCYAKGAGLVCSVHEVRAIRADLEHTQFTLELLVAGIRPLGAATGDQRRVDTPAAAIQAGADHLVVGRPITEADDPVQATADILEEMELAAADLAPSRG